MSTWILVLYIYAGPWAKGDSVSVSPIYGFASEQSCKDAGEKARPLTVGSAKEYRFVCLQQPAKT